jgi:hypothetical protein
VLSNFLGNNAGYGASIGGYFNKVTIGHINNCQYNLIISMSGGEITVGNSIGADIFSVYFSGSYDTRLYFTGKCNNNKGPVVVFNQSFNNYVYDLEADFNGGAAVYDSGNSSDNYFVNALMTGTEFSMTSYKNCYMYSQKHDQTAGNNYIATDYGTIQSVDGATYGHTGSGICWKMSPTNAIRSVDYPLELSLAKVACVADKLVTVTAQMKLTNTTDILGALLCRKKQLDGIAADVKTNMATDDTDYHEVTVTFTPTEAGVVEIKALAWWVANTADESIYVDDMTITQEA